ATSGISAARSAARPACADPRPTAPTRSLHRGADVPPRGNDRMASHCEPLDNSGGANSLLLDLPVPFRRIDGVLHVEAQAHNGIQRWLDNFERVTVCAPCIPDALVDPS